jgi:hypothetical protein
MDRTMKKWEEDMTSNFFLNEKEQGDNDTKFGVCSSSLDLQKF